MENELDDKKIMANENSFLKKISENLYLSLEDINILDNYQIDYQSCKTLKELLFVITNTINNLEDASDLEELSIKLGECNYYNYTNK